MTRFPWLLLAAATALLAGCGRVGALDQPAPLYGEKAKAEYQAHKAAVAAAARAQKDDGEPEPLAPDTPGLNAADSAPATLREQPAPGSHPAPNGPAPRGVLPDPYNHPQ